MFLNLFNRVGLVSLVLSLSACAHTDGDIKQVELNDDNREVIEILQALQIHIHEKDFPALLKLVSPRYFEDMGTSTAKDDYGYAVLKDKILPNIMKSTSELNVSFQVYALEIDMEEGTAHADIRFRSRANLKLQSGSLWDSQRDFNRIQFERENERWLIISGL